jgi:hypothetical protein
MVAFICKENNTSFSRASTICSSTLAIFSLTHVSRIDITSQVLGCLLEPHFLHQLDFNGGSSCYSNTFLGMHEISMLHGRTCDLESLLRHPYVWVIPSVLLYRFRSTAVQISFSHQDWVYSTSLSRCRVFKSLSVCRLSSG